MAKAKPKKHTAAEIAAKAKAATQVRAAAGPAANQACGLASPLTRHSLLCARAELDEQPRYAPVALTGSVSTPPTPPQNAGGGKAGLADRKGGAVGHAKFK